MKTGATICFVMAAVTFGIGINNIVIASKDRELSGLISYGVGSMLPAIGLLIAGLILQRKADKQPPT